VHEHSITVCCVERLAGVWHCIRIAFIDLDPSELVGSLARLLDEFSRPIKSNHPSGFANGFGEQRQEDAAPAANFNDMLARLHCKQRHAAVGNRA